MHNAARTHTHTCKCIRWFTMAAAAAAQWGWWTINYTTLTATETRHNKYSLVLHMATTKTTKANRKSAATRSFVCVCVSVTFLSFDMHKSKCCDTATCTALQHTCLHICTYATCDSYLHSHCHLHTLSHTHWVKQLTLAVLAGRQAKYLYEIYVGNYLWKGNTVSHLFRRPFPFLSPFSTLSIPTARWHYFLLILAARKYRKCKCKYES